MAAAWPAPGAVQRTGGLPARVSRAIVCHLIGDREPYPPRKPSPTYLMTVGYDHSRASGGGIKSTFGLREHVRKRAELSDSNDRA